MPTLPRSKWQRRRALCWKFGLLAGACLGLLVYFGFLLPFWGIPFNKSRHGRVPLTPPWALECWLWEDDANTGAFVQKLLAGYAEHDLPVRTILIDSPWSWRYNDFKVDEDRYLDAEGFFRGLQAQGYRVVLWMTCMVDSQNKDTRVIDSTDFYEAARAKGYLAGGGHQIRWWKGRGGFIDYTNPDARQWWEGRQQQVLDWGVDGWKLDGCDTFFSGAIGKLPVPFNRVHTGWLTTRGYMDQYARREYAHGLKHNPEFATLVRALDGPWSHPEGFAPLDAAPVTWVGDNRHTWSYRERGLESAISDILGSARLGYCVIGSDIAGYHGRSNSDDISAATTAWLSAWQSNREASCAVSNQHGTARGRDEIAPNIYIRWAEFSTFCGLFLNGGHGERRLWKRSAPELEIIRKFAWLHTELVPYMYSHVVACHRGGPPLMRPLSRGDFHYLFGTDLLVAPIYADQPTRTVTLPPGQWRYLFDDRQVFAGPAVITRDFPLDEYPVFVREGAILPLKVARDYTGFGNRESADFTTWLIYPAGKNRFTLWHPETHPQPEATTVTMSAGRSLRIAFSGKRGPHILRIHAEHAPARVTLDDAQLAEGRDWSFEATRQCLIVKTRQYDQGHYVIDWAP